jgi:uncharacterized protein YbjT (DUF2867 family)
MEKILITGATGNVGTAILQHFKPKPHQSLLLATRQIPTAPNELFFDFENLERTLASLAEVDVLFLLRPPQIADTGTYFDPLIAGAKEKNVRHIVFLSVQGAKRVSFIPHAKIEKLILEAEIPYTFIRPSYFMQNLTTTLLSDIRERDRIFLPAGKAPFLWVDVADIGKAVAAVLQAPSDHENQAYTITGDELLNFHEVAELLSQALDRKIEYVSPNLLRFFIAKKRQGMSNAYILVLIMLHYLPRFQQRPEVSADFTKLTGEQPAKLEEFIRANVAMWQ